jgi:hypothetical protein
MPEPPSRDRASLGSFTTFSEAEQAVDRLADQGFPVEHVTIVGQGLRYHEQVQARDTRSSALVAGALQGGLVGAFFAVVFGLVGAIDSIWAFGWLELAGLLYGALAGIVIALIAHALRNRDRDFLSKRSLLAEHYDVLVDERYAESAARLLQRR